MTQPSTKEREVLLNIIELYKDMPYLWDKKHKDYKNKDIRNDGNKVLLEVYKGFDSNVTVTNLVKKIQNLRSGYFKELKKVKESSRTGAGADEVYVPTLWYFDALSFLGSVSEPCRIDQDTMETQEISTSSSETESVRRSESASPQKKKRVTKASLLQKHESLINTAGKLLHKKEEEWEIIGKGIGLQLKDLNKRQFYIAQKIIHDTLYYAQMGMLTEHSSVTGLEHNQSQHTYESTVGNRRTTLIYQAPFRYPARRLYTQSAGASSSPKYYINSDSQSSCAIPSSPSPSPKGLLIESPHPSHYTQPPYSSPKSLPQEPSPQQRSSKDAVWTTITTEMKES
ncbi:unnamed protein product [Parnassius apollo]|uniref:(apollo) hypothetical protein n=1 Tax=Parnassius apollo TaxID=110799 RepID=A0A8S3WVQ2_PARAO|nr:unnamed protein product [Parnassius apollo]